MGMRIVEWEYQSNESIPDARACFVYSTHVIGQ